MSKLPSFQFYPGDWLKDPALSICSAGARGVWIDVICLMFESPRRGYLVSRSGAWTLEQVAVALRGDWQENLKLLKELVHNGVMKQDKKGQFFSKRLVRDERQRETWRGQKRRQRAENKKSASMGVSSQCPPDLHSSSSSSSSNSKQKKQEPPPAAVLRAFESFQHIGTKTPFGPERFQQIWAEEYERINEGTFTDAMEQAIRRCQTENIQIPGLFFSMKRKVEHIELESKCHRTPL